MKISVITVCFNSEATIEETITSVLSQKFESVEYIIIDGNSTDGTLDIIEKHKSRINFVISEPDCGIYDAMNKGIDLSSGDVVALLNSDDLFADEYVLDSVAKEFSNPDIDCVFGDLIYVDRKNPDLKLRDWKASPFTTGSFSRGWHPPHPSFFARKVCYADHGKFDIKIPLVADFELMFRFLEVEKLKSRYIPKILVKMRVGGATGSFKNILRGNIMILNILKKHEEKVFAPRYIFSRIAPKIMNSICIRIKHLVKS